MNRLVSVWAEENERRIKELQEELEAREDLIGRKQAELSRANQKHYELEQELAFYKIDTKFTSLHKKPDTPSVVVSSKELSHHVKTSYCRRFKVIVLLPLEWSDFMHFYSKSSPLAYHEWTLTWFLLYVLYVCHPSFFVL